MRYSSRKFLLTAAVTGTAILALFTHYLDQQHFLWTVSLTLGMYKAAQTIDDKMNGRHE
jgi:hypothetical protein